MYVIPNLCVMYYIVVGLMYMVVGCMKRGYGIVSGNGVFKQNRRNQDENMSLILAMFSQRM